MPDSENKDVATALEVVSGNPTERELAAIVAVLSETASTTQSEQPEPNWAKGTQMLRDGNSSVALEWRSDFKGEI
jgi:hypothetical protein